MSTNSNCVTEINLNGVVLPPQPPSTGRNGIDYMTAAISYPSIQRETGRSVDKIFNSKGDIPVLSQSVNDGMYGYVVFIVISIVNALFTVFIAVYQPPIHCGSERGENYETSVAAPGQMSNSLADHNQRHSQQCSEMTVNPQVLRRDNCSKSVHQNEMYSKPDTSIRPNSTMEEQEHSNLPFSLHDEGLQFKNPRETTPFDPSRAFCNVQNSNESTPSLSSDDFAILCRDYIFGDTSPSGARSVTSDSITGRRPSSWRKPRNESTFPLNERQITFRGAMMSTIPSNTNVVSPQWTASHLDNIPTAISPVHYKSNGNIKDDAPTRSATESPATKGDADKTLKRKRRKSKKRLFTRKKTRSTTSNVRVPKKDRDKIYRARYKAKCEEKKRRNGIKNS